jgi:hypothetical protein
VLLGVADTVLERLTVVEPLLLSLGVCEAVGVAVLELVPVIELVGVTDSLAVEVEESVPVSLPVNVGPAPIVTDAVCECEIDLDSDAVEVGVTDDVLVPVMVPLVVGVTLIDTVLVVLPVFVLLGEFGGVELCEIDGICEDEGVCVINGVCDDKGVKVAGLVSELAGLFIVDPEGILDTLTDELNDTDGDALPVELTLPLEEIDDVLHVDAEPLIVTEGDSVVEEEEEIVIKLTVVP